FEEISKAWMGVAGILGSHSLATLILARYGTPKQRARWLPDLATGERRSGIALTEPQAGSDLQGIATVARRADDHYVVNGAKTWITNARHAFGRPIAEFQAIHLKLADMATEVQAARLLTWWAALALDSGRRADLETGMAKLYASEVRIKASLEAMRIHGGYGYSTEYEIERFYRDAPLMAIGEGTNDILRTVIARQLVREYHSLPRLYLAPMKPI